MFSKEDGPHLKAWLIRTLEPICDAEPGALADYVLALLKHSGPESELRKEMSAQLDEFLEKESAPFLNTLFSVLRTKSYLPYSTAGPSSRPPGQENGTSHLQDGHAAPNLGRKRSFDHEERDGRAPSKVQRIGSDGQFQFSRYGGSRDAPSTGSWLRGGTNGYRDEGPPSHGQGSNGINSRRPSAYQPPQSRGVCRDYHMNGYCSRGAYCRYSHGEDAVVPGQLFPVNGSGIPNTALPFMPIYPGVYPPGPAAYDPRDSQMDMRSNRSHMQSDYDESLPFRTPEVPLAQDLPGHHVHASHPPLHPSLPLPNPQSYPESFPPGVSTFIPPNPAFPSMDVDPAGGRGPQRPRNNVHGRRPTDRIPGTFNGEAPNFRPEKRKDKTLVVEKIPEDKLTLEHVNEWFKRFGTVTNVAIDKPSAKALISFSTHEEAHAAWKSEDAVFSNRFVKLFWHRPMEGHGQKGAQLLAASAPAVAAMSQPQEHPPATSLVASKKTLNSTAATLAARQKVLEEQIAEQKSLMSSLETASPSEKKSIMMRLRKLGEEMKLTRVPASEAVLPHDAKKAQGDEELNQHASSTDDNQAETTEDLKLKLQKLKAEAASLGIPEQAGELGTSSHRPYRGRGRGRGYFRGGPIRGSMKLDNRPKSLLVKGASEKGIQALEDWYSTTGQLDSVTATSDGDLLVSFKTRAAAEQGLAKGMNIPTVGALQIAWSIGNVASRATSPPAGTEDSKPMEADPIDSPQRPPSPAVPEEESTAGGWGGDDEGRM